MAAPVTNPLQTNNTIAMALAYATGVLASKFPFFDAATWNSILLALLDRDWETGAAILNDP